ncbi:MAG: hydrolase [Pseudomonadota bacterium]
MSLAERITRDFKPAWWLPGPHLQTLWPPLFRRFKNKLPLRRERIELADGDFVDLDWSQREHGPIVLLLHGLEGSVNSPYARGLLHECNAQGWRAVVMHFRGCSGELNRLPRAYHSGDTADLAEVVNLLREREPNTVLAAIGVSLGGNVLLKWLGETGSNNPLITAAAISVPFDLSKSVDFLQQGFSRVYDKHLLTCVKEKFARKLATTELAVSLSQLQSFKNLREFDDKITAPLHGFIDAADYYIKSSCRPYLSSINVPTLIVNALDDPFVPIEVIPTVQEISSQVTLALTERGGHVGFIGGASPWRPEYWLENEVAAFLKLKLQE